MSNKKIRVGITGYGNLGRGVEAALQHAPDMQLAAVFSRRDPSSVHLLDDSIPVYPLEQAENFQDQIDVMILCGGSKSDLPEQGPWMAALFNTVDSYDTHASIPDYYSSVDKPARESGHVYLLSTGWDPGLFSINRLMGEAILPKGQSYTFWGKGLSQGHSDAVRRIPGVKGGVQYTIPSEQAIARVRNGEQPELSTREKHVRECYVALEDGVDADQVRQAIVSMPAYFADYDTTVHFIDAPTLAREHSAMPHGGFVIRSGHSGQDTVQVMEFSLKLDSNPEFTASVLVAYARAIYKLSRLGDLGAKTVFDIAPGLLSPKSPAQLRKELL